MKEINDGGSAFPHLGVWDSKVGEFELQDAPGMTLRAYLAAKAMQGFCANPNLAGRSDDIACMAISHADALIAALNK